MSDLDDQQFDALEDRVEQLAKQAAEPAKRHRDPNHRFDPAHSETDFEQLVRDALDGLPADVQKRLGNTAVVVSDSGAERGLYGLYQGVDGPGQTGLGANFFGGPPDEPQILIFRDTLVGSFGHDPELLRAAVTRTVRHEVGHSLGLDEAGVRRLGL